MNKSKTILVTGGAGFIGANLVRTLIKTTADTVHIMVEKNSDLWRLHDILSGLAIHEADLANFDAVRKLIHKTKPSIIYHLASYGGMCTQQNTANVYNVNFYGTMNLLNVCKEVGFECFINTGSSSEYGMKEHAMSETMPLEPISDYGVAKAAATQYCLKEALFNKLPVYTVRPFSIYGDYEAPIRLIPTVLVNTLLNKPLQLSSPHFVRDYLYVKDMVDLFIAVEKHKPQDAFIFNGGTGVQSTINDVVETTAELVSLQAAVEWGASTPRPWEPMAWKADISNAEKFLGWKPQHSLHDGIKASLEWFAQHLHFYDTVAPIDHISPVTRNSAQP